MEVILAVATLLGGISAIWYFWEKARSINWSQVRLSRAKLERKNKAKFVIAHSDADSSIVGLWPNTQEPIFPEILVKTVAAFFPDFHLPTTKDIQWDWALYGNPDTLFPFFCSGDFFGIRQIAYAGFILHNDESKWNVIVIPQIRTDPHQPIVLESGFGKPQNMFIQAVKPGRYRTIYDKGYSISSLKAPRIIRLHRDAINLGTFESADAIYYWNKRKKQFTEVWLSD
jgi:hypothetical protein